MNNVFTVLAAIALSAVTVLAFTSADFGARELTANVVNDSAAYLAITDGGSDEVLVADSADGVTITFGAGEAGATGTGINPGSTYVFEDVLTLTNKGASVIDVTLSTATGDDCEVQFAGGTAFGSTDTHSALAVAGTVNVDIKLVATDLSVGDALACTLTLSAVAA